MKRLSKILVLLLTLSLILCTIPAAYAAEESVVDYETVLVVGENKLTLKDAEYTLFTFEPDEIGIYTLSVSSGATIGYWGAGSFFYSNPHSTATSIEREIKDVGQQMLIGIKSNKSSVTLTIKKTGESAGIVEPTYTPWENKVTPNQSVTIPSLVKVDISEYHTAYKVNDGEYRLDSADGPRLYVDLDTSEWSISEIFEEAFTFRGQYEGVHYNFRAPLEEYGGGKGKNYGMGEYYDVLKNTGGRYPLTTDLLAFIKGWGCDGAGYWTHPQGSPFAAIKTDDDGNTPKVNADTAWMVVCLYDPSSAGQGGGQPHTHSGGTATCQAAAKCDECGQSYGGKDPNNHKDTAEWKTTSTTHTKTYSCCGASVVAKENHEWKNGACSECGYSCQHTGGTATCVNKPTCTVCGQPYGNKISSNHTGTAEWTKTDKTHTKTYSCCNATVVAKENHEWKNGACTECGYSCQHTGGTATCVNKPTCTVCGQSYGKKDSSNHTGETNWTTTDKTHTKTYSCCDAIVVAEEKHKLKDGTCEECGYGCKHTGGTATCQAQAVCTTCGKGYGNLNPDRHSGKAQWSKTPTTHTKAYSCCNAVVVATEKHEWKNGTCSECGYSCQHSGGTATCQDKAVCTVCGVAYGGLNVKNHTSDKLVYTSNGNGTHQVVQECCKVRVDADEACAYGADRICDHCGYTKPETPVDPPDDPVDTPDDPVDTPDDPPVEPTEEHLTLAVGENAVALKPNTNYNLLPDLMEMVGTLAWTEGVTVTVNGAAVESPYDLSNIFGKPWIVATVTEETEAVFTITLPAEDVPVLILGSNAIEVTDSYEGTTVVFTADAAGTYTIMAAEGEANACVMIETDSGSEDATLPYTFTLDAGASQTFIILTLDWSEDTIDLVLEEGSCKHGEPEHHQEIPATTEAEGTREHWSCGNCGKLFADEACTVEVTAEELVIAKLEPSGTEAPGETAAPTDTQMPDQTEGTEAPKDPDNNGENDRTWIGIVLAVAAVAACAVGGVILWKKKR